MLFQGDDAMAKIMTASNPMTDGQIENAVDKLRASMRKHRSEIASDVAQRVLGVENLGMEMFSPFRKHAEAMSEMVVRHFKVNRAKTREAMVAALNRKQYVDADVLATMPTDGPEEGDLFFFPLERDTPAGGIAQVFASHDLVPDYVAQMQVNADDPAFADEHPNGMQWGGGPSYSFAIFGLWYGERGVHVYRSGVVWYGFCWFAGRLK
jgi:hypothetical protein